MHKIYNLNYEVYDIENWKCIFFINVIINDWHEIVGIMHNRKYIQQHPICFDHFFNMNINV